MTEIPIVYSMTKYLGMYGNRRGVVRLVEGGGGGGGEGNLAKVSQRLDNNNEPMTYSVRAEVSPIFCAE